MVKCLFFSSEVNKQTNQNITGEHSIDVRLFNQSVYESPFICNVGDPDLVTVRNMPEFINADELFRDYTFESMLIYNKFKLK